MNVYICMCSPQTLVLPLQAAPKCQEVWEQLMDMSMLWASYWCLNVKCFLWAHVFEDLAFPDGTVLGGCWTFVIYDLINGSGFLRSSLLGVISSSVPPELSISWFIKIGKVTLWVSPPPHHPADRATPATLSVLLWWTGSPQTVSQSKSLSSFH